MLANPTLHLIAPLFEFRLLSETEVHELIKSSTKTTCSLDPIRTKLFTECRDVLPNNNNDNNNLILILRP